MSEDRFPRAQIEQRLRATEERFRIAQAAGGIGWFEWDLVTDAWECSTHVAILFGFNPATPRPLFADWQPAIFIDDVPKLRSAVEVAGERGAVPRSRHRLARRSRRPRRRVQALRAHLRCGGGLHPRLGRARL